MKRKYYALFNCDEWKSTSSMSFVGVFNFKKLINLIKKRVRNGDYEFDNEIKEIETMEWDEIETLLEYGHIQEVSINEVLD